MVPTGNSTTTLMALLFVGVAAFYLKSVAAAAITEGPVSLIALIGTNAQFHCAGTGNYLVWVVDGLQTEHPDILARGITTELVQSSGTVHSTLTVPATSVNNGTTVRCRVIAGLGGTPAVSDQANLTVVQGVSVGPVLNPRFSPTFDAIMWDPPSTVGVLSGLTYHLTVTNVNTDVVDINTTTADTSYPLGPLEFCVNYTASVTVLHTSTTIPEHKTARTPGSDYIVEDVTIWVIVSQYDTVRVNVSLQVKLPFDQFKPCKTQNLSIEIRFRWNNSVYTYFGQLIQGHDIAAVVNYSILMNKSLHLIALIGIGDQNLTILYFSTFAVQNCDVLTNHTSYILVECTFAINSTAPGFVLIQDEHSQYTINTTLQRHEGDVGKGSANITDLPTGEYNVTVYDEMEDYTSNILAYVSSHMQIYDYKVQLTASSSTLFVYFSDSRHVYTSSPVNSLLSSHATPIQTSKVASESHNIVVIGLATAISTSVIIVTLVSVMCVICLVLKVHRRKKMPGPIDTIHWKQDMNNYVDIKDFNFNQVDHMNPHRVLDSASEDMSVMTAGESTDIMASQCNTTTHMFVVTDNETQSTSTNEEAYSTNSTATTESKPIVYAVLLKSTDPPAAPPPTQPVVYAEVKHSTNPPAAPLPIEHKPNSADLYHNDIHQHASDVHVSVSVSAAASHHNDPADDTQVGVVTENSIPVVTHPNTSFSNYEMNESLPPTCNSNSSGHHSRSSSDEKALYEPERSAILTGLSHNSDNAGQLTSYNSYY